MNYSDKRTAKRVAHRIASKVLNIHTLNRRNRDSLDFHELSVWQIEDALIAAYERGLINCYRSMRMN